MIFLPCLLSGLGRKWVLEIVCCREKCGAKGKINIPRKSWRSGYILRLIFQREMHFRDIYKKTHQMKFVKSSSLGRSSLTQNHFQNLKHPSVLEYIFVLFLKCTEEWRRKKKRKKGSYFYLFGKNLLLRQYIHFISIISGMLIIRII